MLFRKYLLPLILCGLTSVGLAQQQTNSQPSAGVTNAAATAAKQQAFDRLLKELEDLIPGTYDKDSQEQQTLTDVVYGFIAGNQTRVSESLSKLIQLDEKVPPRELLLAGLAYSSNNAAGGRALLEQAGVRHREHPAIPLAFARLALIQGRYFEAFACIEKARQSNNQSNLGAELKKYYEIACLDSLTVIEIRRNELKPAERYALQWQQLAPESDKMLLAAGEVKFLQEKIDEAVSFLNRRSDNIKNVTPTQLILGKWFQAKNDDANYGKWIDEAFAKHPDNPITQLEFAALQIRTEKFERAASVVAEYEAANGESQQSKLIKARVAFANNDFESAEKNFTQLLQSQPNSFEHAYFLILSMLESKDDAKRKQAVELAKRAYQTFRNNQLLAAALGWALYQTGDKKLGTDLLAQAKGIGSTLPDTAYFLAEIMAADGRNVQAKTLLSPFVNSPAVFVYRERAKSLLKSLGSSEDLPTPGDK